MRSALDRSFTLDTKRGCRHSPRAGRLMGWQDSMKLFWLRFFTWWNGATLNTLFHTYRNGELVGHDEFGNAYYRTLGGKIDPALGFERRWVIYNGVSEASMTPPGWNGWLHQTVDTPPSEEPTYHPREWQLPHRGNPTGTPAAVRPKGSTLRRGPRQPSGGDYQAWTPGG
jgi:NADH:ubiquinone oxidoreductase subunit